MSHDPDLHEAHVGPAVWKTFSVDGETYYRTSCACEQRVGDGPSEPTENLSVSRRAYTPGIGPVHSAGTVVTEQHAVDLVRLAKEHGTFLERLGRVTVRRTGSTEVVTTAVAVMTDALDSGTAPDPLTGDSGGSGTSGGRW